MKKVLLFPAVVLSIGAMNAQNTLDYYLMAPPTYKTIGTSTNQINKPRDLDFKPNSNELWVLNRESGPASTTIFSNAGLTNQSSVYRQDAYVDHFMDIASGIAMGAVSSVPGSGSAQLFAIATEGTNGGDNFMGPTLWPADLSIYAQLHQNDSYLGSHCDMLHQSPKSMGIAHESANIYWVADGNKGNIVKYDFATPHEYGGDDHSDGKVWRYGEVKFTYKAGVPSHLAVDKANQWLYIADTGGKRIVRMKTTSGTASGNLSQTMETLALYKAMTGVTWEVCVNTGLTAPSGIDYSNGRLVVTDNGTGEVIIYNTTGSTVVEMGRISTGATSIMGVKIGPDNKIWYVDYTANKVVRIEPGTATSVQEVITSNSLSVYPNPTVEKVNIDFQLTRNDKADISIFDLPGKLINTVSSEAKMGDNHVELNLSGYAPGVYFVKLNVGKESYTQKVVVQ